MMNLPAPDWFPGIKITVLRAPERENTLKGEKSGCGMQVEESRYSRDKRKERIRLKTTVKSRMRQKAWWDWCTYLSSP